MQIEEIAAKLEPLGLTDKEARVYVASLFLGQAVVQKIAEQAEINRATAYVILDRLAELGLVSQSTESKKTVFIAEGPESLDRLFELQKEEIELRKKELRHLLPELQQVERSTGSEAPVVRFYKGPEGIKTIGAYLKRKASYKGAVYVMVNVDEVVAINPEIPSQNTKARVRKKLSSKMIYSYSDGDIASDKKILRETKKIKEPIKADINLYEDVAAFMTYHGKGSTGVVLESKEIVGALRQLFDLAWNNKAK